MLEVYLKYAQPPSFHYGEWDLRCEHVSCRLNLTEYHMSCRLNLTEIHMSCRLDSNPHSRGWSTDVYDVQETLVLERSMSVFRTGTLVYLTIPC